MTYETQPAKIGIHHLGTTTEENEVVTVGGIEVLTETGLHVGEPWSKGDCMPLYSLTLKLGGESFFGPDFSLC